MNITQHARELKKYLEHKGFSVSVTTYKTDNTIRVNRRPRGKDAYICIGGQDASGNVWQEKSREPEFFAIQIGDNERAGTVALIPWWLMTRAYVCIYAICEAISTDHNALKMLAIMTRGSVYYDWASMTKDDWRGLLMQYKNEQPKEAKDDMYVFLHLLESANMLP
jgi:hypothetical protein